MSSMLMHSRTFHAGEARLMPWHDKLVDISTLNHVRTTQDYTLTILCNRPRLRTGVHRTDSQEHRRNYSV